MVSRGPWRNEHCDRTEVGCKSQLARFPIPGQMLMNNQARQAEVDVHGIFSVDAVNGVGYGFGPIFSSWMLSCYRGESWKSYRGYHVDTRGVRNGQ